MNWGMRVLQTLALPLGYVTVWKKEQNHCSFFICGAGDEARTRYLHLGKVALYQMSYGRISIVAHRAFPATSIIIPQLSPLVNYKFAFFEKRDVSVSPLRTKLRRRSSLPQLTRRKFNCFPFLMSL